MLAPSRLDKATFIEFEPDGPKRAALVRALELLDPDDTDALVEYVSDWGFLQGAVRSHLADEPVWDREGIVPCEPAFCLSPPGEPPSPEGPRKRVVYEEPLVPCMPLSLTRELVRDYQNTLERYANLRKLQGNAKRVEREAMALHVVEQLDRYGGSLRDPKTGQALIGSVIATAYQRLLESTGRQAPRRCENRQCDRPFTLAETDKRPDAPPRFCSSKCQVAYWRALNNRSKTGAPQGRRGR